MVIETAEPGQPEAVAVEADDLGKALRVSREPNLHQLQSFTAGQPSASTDQGSGPTIGRPRDCNNPGASHESSKLRSNSSSSNPDFRAALVSSPVIELSGSRVRLRAPTLDDVDALAAAADADPSSMGRTQETTRDRLLERIERKPTLEHDGFLGLVVEYESRLVGDIQARAPMHGMPPGGCEIGISLFPESRGLGIGREAVALLTGHLLDAGFHRVQATTATTNTAMRRVLEHVGYTFEGILRDYGPTGEGGREDFAMYSFTARDRAPAG